MSKILSVTFYGNTSSTQSSPSIITVSAGYMFSRYINGDEETIFLEVLEIKAFNIGTGVKICFTDGSYMVVQNPLSIYYAAD